ncbi:hypothetical protein [Desulfogranum japonicum]|uniref:hypothetical protein n=1 Tax=Desulfogranum japonicum TaxID=231447 RepID=UPI000401EF3A|nr:hypothetical protein [Desulfogranum japonicum]
MKIINKILLSAICLLMLGGFAASNLYLLRQRTKFSFQSSSLVLALPPSLLKIFSGEFSGLIADKIILDISAFVGSKQKKTEQDWDNIEALFKQTLNLDPFFQQSYMLVQGILPWRAHRPQKANKLLAISRDARPYDWRPGYYMGFNSYYFLNDYENAGMQLLHAAKIKDAPVLLAVLGSRLSSKSGLDSTLAATALLQSIRNELLNNTDITNDADKKNRLKEINDRIEALNGLVVIKEKILEYKKKNGFFPFSLNYLVYKKYLWKIPDNPYAEKFYYNNRNGEIAFDEINIKNN